MKLCLLFLYLINSLYNFVTMWPTLNYRYKLYALIIWKLQEWTKPLKVVRKAKERKLKSFWQAVSEAADIPLKAFSCWHRERLCVAHQVKPIKCCSSTGGLTVLHETWKENGQTFLLLTFQLEIMFLKCWMRERKT